ncbi:MAG: leucine-rich repeat domain-containing protein [Oscillospiraceae bacterium]|nr:leucine-rich repeat domain-containing protein [Oscillospiraceae bacterium]
MNAARYFVNGYATGFNDGLKAGGGEPTPKPETDEEFEKFKSLTEPEENQTVFLVCADTDHNQIKLNARCDTSINGTANLIVQWGDGTTETINISDNPQKTVEFSHDYSKSGDYTVIITSDNILFCSCWILTGYTSVYWKMAKYGEKIHVESYSSGGFSSLPCANNLRYIKIPADTDFSNGQFFYSCCALRRIIYDGENLTSIPDKMFGGCYCLEFDDWDFSEVTNIGTYAFYYCSKLTSINLSACTSIGDYAFANTSLEKIILNLCESIGIRAFYFCNKLETAIIPICQIIPEYMFYGCATLKEINLPMCAEVGNQAFSSCYNLRTVTFADGCTFGTNAFIGCYALFPKPDGTFY